MYVRMYVCTYVFPVCISCMYVCGWMDGWMYVWMYVSMGCTHGCMSIYLCLLSLANIHCSFSGEAHANINLCMVLNSSQSIIWQYIILSYRSSFAIIVFFSLRGGTHKDKSLFGAEQQSVNHMARNHRTISTTLVIAQNTRLFGGRLDWWDLVTVFGLPLFLSLTR